MKKIKLFLAVLGFVSLTTFAAGSVSQVSAAYDPLSKTCQSGRSDSNNSPESSTVCQDKGNGSNPITGKNGIILKVSTIIAIIAGVVAVIMVIVGGAGIILANGDANAVKTARTRIVHALIGLVIIVLAQGIVSIVIGQLLN